MECPKVEACELTQTYLTSDVLEWASLVIKNI